MNDETLRQLLERVHERLNASGPIDPEDREILSQVMRDIDAKSASPHRLEAIAVRFENEHPAVAQLLRQVGTLLGQAGI
jgi:hypothetical protein